MADDTSYVNQHNGEYLVATAVLFLVLSWLSVSLRTYVRAFMTNAFELDDWLMLTAQGNFTLSCGFILVGVNNGLGRHNSALPEAEAIRGMKWQALATATYITNMMFIKLSIGVFLLRLAAQRRFKWIIWVSMGIIFIMSSVLFFWDLFQCKPVAAQWDTTIPGYQCIAAIEVVNAAYALSVLNIVTDWLYALLPIPMIWNAKMTTQAKMTVALVLSLGVFASVATLIRVKFLIALTDSEDILYAGTEAMVWTLIEPGVAIVAASLVTIRPLLRQMRLRGFESSERSRSRNIFNRYNRSRGTAEILDDEEELHGVDGKHQKAGAKTAKTTNGGTVSSMKLKDLETGHVDSSRPMSWPDNQGFAAGEQTKKMVLVGRADGRGGIAVAVTVQEELEELAQQENNDDDDDDDNNSTNNIKKDDKSHNKQKQSRSNSRIKKASPRMQEGSGGIIGMTTTTITSSSSTTTTTTTKTTDARMWRSKTPSSPSSPEESDVIQGLRFPERRDVKTQSPFP